MNPAIDFIRKAVGAQVCQSNKEIDRPSSQEEMTQIYRLSCLQDMAHLVAAELDKQGCLKDDSISEKFRHQQMLAVFRYQRIQYEFTEICRVLEAKKIPHIPLKGSVLRHYYPEPWMRTSADIDLLVHTEDLDQATQCLVNKLGYRNNGIERHDVQMVAPSGVHLELHFDTVEEKRAGNASEILNKIWNHSYLEQGYDFRYALSDDMFYFYHIAHMAKHFETGGCGFRFFLDQWLLNHKKEFDRNAREILLHQGGLLTFETAATELSEVWFSEKAHTSMSERMEQYVFEGGVYGSADNAVAVKQIKKGSSLKYTLGLIFLPYSSLKKIYPILEKHPFLLPFCQFARWIKLIFSGRMKSSVNKLKHSATITKKQKKHVNDLLTELGLEASAGV